MQKDTPSILLLLFSILAIGAAQAQEATMPQRWMVTDYEIEPGMQMQHMALARRYLAAAQAVDWPYPWAVSATIASERPRFAVAIPVDSMEMMEQQRNLIVEAEGADAFAEVMGMVKGTYQRVSTRMAVERRDLGVEPPQREDFPVGYWSIRARVAPGKNGAYEEYLRAIVQASDGGQYWNAFQGSFGASGNYVANIPIWEWGDMDSPPGPGVLQRLQAEFGERRGTSIYETGSALIEELDVELMRWRWDLSYLPANDD